MTVNKSLILLLDNRRICSFNVLKQGVVMMRRSSAESKETETMLAIVHDAVKQGDVPALKEIDELGFPLEGEVYEKTDLPMVVAIKAKQFAVVNWLKKKGVNRVLFSGERNTQAADDFSIVSALKILSAIFEIKDIKAIKAFLQGVNLNVYHYS
ncbi:hypothetical protein [Coxiella burnetii]|uniref:Uncharacterized protein n=1 Tax=Coxiella burnetii (strain RSA 493 / Nine Mile phase I) TaxID=227377 RepID=Q83D80_COXBU|nr:hypothetical protein [Coxiella burnetii]NP_819879.2 hypothetical protein CBU_0860 [Coxiella burnetii RSA 493]AAO90393.2 hypothetical protein CBU_0860 [Coxiella burnetii RSA 493]ARI65695.1 hypothetical protein B7L74_04390 [Coxiella burnetii]MCF2092919.1 hypothetical protein [Coxiella burnetii]MCF2094885.1 hypothetical protein [Coxiella burnetii]MCF2096987.1 hypothetical protein [Coxiella burnetii]